MSLAVVLPAGISFYTFETIRYTVDVYRRHIPPEPDFWYFACFVSLFPHLIAGPIIKPGDLLPQLHALEPRASVAVSARHILVRLWPLQEGPARGPDRLVDRSHLVQRGRPLHAHGVGGHGWVCHANLLRFQRLH